MGDQEVLLALGNGEVPALQFQADPGGTGALLEELWGEVGGTPYRRETFEIEPWTGPVPGTEEEIAFLPAHRLAALLRERKITSVDLTDIYLRRLHRLSPPRSRAATGRSRSSGRALGGRWGRSRWRRMPCTTGGSVRKPGSSFHPRTPGTGHYLPLQVVRPARSTCRRRRPPREGRVSETPEAHGVAGCAPPPPSHPRRARGSGSAD